MPLLAASGPTQTAPVSRKQVVRAWGVFVLGVIVIVVVALALHWWLTREPGVTATKVIPARTYGSSGARFVVSFGATPRLSTTEPLSSTFYVAKLAPNAYESAGASMFAHRKTPAEIEAYLRSLTNLHLMRWQGHPAAGFDVPCRVGDSYTRCPGRIAERDVVIGNVVFELRANQIAESEVRRFFNSFRAP